MKVLLEYLDWSEEQWDEYEATKVEITLDRLGTFITACELLRDGNRLNDEERKAWTILIKEIFPTYLNLITNIIQGKA